MTEASTESAATDLPKPKAKTERLIVREIDGETLAYDRGRAAASCLNEFAARVWRECDGETSVAEIAAALGEDELAVWLALHQLAKAQLLTEAIAFPPDMIAPRAATRSGRGWDCARRRSSPASSRRCQRKLPAVESLARLAQVHLLQPSGKVRAVQAFIATPFSAVFVLFLRCADRDARTLAFSLLSSTADWRVGLRALRCASPRLRVDLPRLAVLRIRIGVPVRAAV
jgi:Coenzyme PQQ synthesis protein D (PqqD)